MKQHATDNFRHGGHEAWWRGLKEAVTAAKARLKSAATDEEQRTAQSKLDELKRQESNAQQNGHRWLH